MPNGPIRIAAASASGAFDAPSAGTDADRDELDQRVDGRDGRDHRHQSERDVALRVLELAGGRPGVLEAGVGEEEQERGLAEALRVGRRNREDAPPSGARGLRPR